MLLTRIKCVGPNSINEALATKFHARPLKFMSKEEAHKVIGFINNVIN